MKTILLFWLLVNTGWCVGQNLVPNPSFEEYTECVNGVAQVCRVTDWHVCRSSPDYFNACAPASSQFSVPDNLFGHQYPRTGDAYCGFFTYPNPLTLFITGDYREILGTQLISPMVIGTKYFVSFYVNMSFGGAKIATNKTGILFSTTMLDSTFSPAPINNFSQFYTDSIITDSVNWVRISGSIVADSAYAFMCIGNFFKNINTDTIMYDQQTLGAYYYIDDVCISTDSLTCNGIIEGVAEDNRDYLFKIFPNPTKGQIQVTNDSYMPFEVSIYSSIGQAVFNEFENGVSIFIDMTGFPSGVYYVLIRQNEYTVQKQIIKY